MVAAATGSVCPAGGRLRQLTSVLMPADAEAVEDTMVTADEKLVAKLVAVLSCAPAMA